MFQVYFDDSGTDAKSEIAIAACYISTKRGWEAFVEGWDQARWEEGFEVFHMADFVARPEHGHKPFCTWNNSKKDHVYGRLLTSSTKTNVSELPALFLRKPMMREFLMISKCTTVQSTTHLLFGNA
jgi:hypothetical protein